MKVLHAIKKLRVRSKVYLMLGLFLLFVFFSFYVFYDQQVEKTFSDTHVFMTESLDDIAELMNVVETLTDSGFTKADYQLLKPFFQEKRFYETGYPFLVNRSGKYLIHPWKEGTNEANSENQQKRLSYGEGSGYFKYAFSKDNRTKWQYVQYFKPYDAYITVTFYEDELFRNLSSQRKIFIAFIGIALIVFLLGTVFTINPIVIAIKRVSRVINAIAKGEVVESLKNKRLDEIGEMMRSINKLIDEISKKTYFSNEIAKGNLNCELQLDSDADVLGKSLINMRDSIAYAQEEEKKQQLEVEKQSWENKGLSSIAELLRESSASMEEFSYRIISSLVKYVGASQGGFYLMSNGEKGDSIIKMMAGYACEKKILENREFEIGEGLVGESIAEKETMLVTDIPESYLNISSGMGCSAPKCILIVPLKTDDNAVVGALEMASFNLMEQYVIQFIEKIANSTASTISKLEMNLQTERLLQQTQEQAEQMKLQEEELRQNMEEMLATQEELQRKESDLKAEISQLRNENERLAKLLDGNK